MSRERRSLIFRTYQPAYPATDPNTPAPDPEDNGYNFKHSGHIRLVVNTMKDNGFRQIGSKNWILNWNIGNLKSDQFINLQSWQKVNNFPKASEITRKDKLNRNISKMQLKHAKAYGFVPPTYLLP